MARETPKTAQSWCDPNFFRINTYKSASKQRALSSFRMNTYEKLGEGSYDGVLPKPSFALRHVDHFWRSILQRRAVKIPIQRLYSKPAPRQ
jgi:hypothetical protein